MFVCLGSYKSSFSTPGTRKETGTQVISFLLFLDAITLELSITCKINCFSHAIEIDHLVKEAELTQCYTRDIWSSGTHPETCPRKPPTSLNIFVVWSSVKSIGDLTGVLTESEK